MGLGGFLGALLRYGAGGAIQRLVPAGAHYPLGTLGVNVIGSLCIGLLSGLAESRGLLGSEARLFLIVGLLGSFTTFSTFSLESLQLARNGQWALFALNAGAQFGLSLGAVWLGWFLTRH